MQPALRERRARPGGDAGRRLRRRGRDRQRPHPRRRSEPPDRRAESLRGARRGLHAPRRFSLAKRPPGRGRQADLRQSAQLRRRLAAPARPAGHRLAAAPVLRLCLGRGQRTLRQEAARSHSCDEPLRPADQSADDALPDGGRDARPLPRDRSPAREPRLRYRRRRLQGRRPRAAAAARLRVALAPLGGGAQVPGRAGDDGSGDDRDPGRAHRRADAGRQAEAGHRRRRRRLQRDAAQRGRDRPQGRPGRRHGGGAAGRRRHPADRRGHAG